MSVVLRRWLAVARSLSHDTRASALVEGAIVMPLLVVLLFGIYEFSWFFYQQHVISYGLRNAARYLARARDPCILNSPSWNEATRIAKNLAATGSPSGGQDRVKGWSGTQIVVSCSSIENQTFSQSNNFYRGGAIVYVVTVATRFVDPSLGFFNLLGLQLPVISLAHSERVIGPS
jgi:Flp pilus assembly protein TadG